MQCRNGLFSADNMPVEKCKELSQPVGEEDFRGDVLPQIIVCGAGCPAVPQQEKNCEILSPRLEVGFDVHEVIDGLPHHRKVLCRFDKSRERR
jgi:hypothetical protein